MQDKSYYQNVKFIGELPFVLINHKNIQAAAIQSHWHPDLEINALFDGRVDFMVDGVQYSVESGHLIIINSDAIHSSIPDLNSFQKEESGITVIIKNTWLKEAIPNYEELVFPAVAHPKEEQIYDLLKQIHRLNQNELNVTNYLQITGYVYMILSVIFEHVERKKMSTSLIYAERMKIKGILEDIHENYCNIPMQREMADKYHFSKEYFCRMFKHYTGMTFIQYVQQLRLAEAAKLLRGTDESVISIAQEVGFSTEQYFSRVFKDYFGVTPGRYRRENESPRE